MSDTTVIKVDSNHSPTGPDGEKFLATGKSMSMRMWDEQPGESKQPVSREYETVGYVLEGRAELKIENQTVTLQAGDSWVVAKGSSHTYRILEHFKAIEATHPPSQLHGRK